MATLSENTCEQCSSGCWEYNSGESPRILPIGSGYCLETKRIDLDKAGFFTCSPIIPRGAALIKRDTLACEQFTKQSILR